MKIEELEKIVTEFLDNIDNKTSTEMLEIKNLCLDNNIPFDARIIDKLINETILLEQEIEIERVNGENK